MENIYGKDDDVAVLGIGVLLAICPAMKRISYSTSVYVAQDPFMRYLHKN